MYLLAGFDFNATWRSPIPSGRLRKNKGMPIGSSRVNWRNSLKDNSCIRTASYSFLDNRAHVKPFGLPHGGTARPSAVTAIAPAPPTPTRHSQPLSRSTTRSELAQLFRRPDEQRRDFRDPPPHPVRRAICSKALLVTDRAMSALRAPPRAAHRTAAAERAKAKTSSHMPNRPTAKKHLHLPRHPAAIGR